MSSIQIPPLMSRLLNITDDPTWGELEISHPTDVELHLDGVIKHPALRATEVGEEG